MKDDKIISNNESVADTLNTFFVNDVSSLNITLNENLLEKTEDTNDLKENIINLYKTRPCIKIILE